MTAWLAVMIGGALGAGGRYGVGLLFGREGGFPWGTLTVNLVGGLAMGLLAGWLLKSGDDAARLFLGVGVLGGFTTFSAFGLETFAMIERGATVQAMAYATASVCGAVVLTALGYGLAKA